MQKTRLGWILAGRTNTTATRVQTVQSLHTSVSNFELHNQIARFWQIDDVSNNPTPYTIEQKICEEHFLANVSKNEQGQYIVKLPFKQNILRHLGDSRSIALKRFRALEKRFDRNPELRTQYSEFMTQYRALGHMRLATHQPSDEFESCYLPHHCVFKDSPTVPRYALYSTDLARRKPGYH